MAIRDGGGKWERKDVGCPFARLGKEVREKCDAVWVGNMKEID